ncbi:hypothetical protein [Actinomadura nitritigenes]|uniref:hypothetical protein n=1 Tax=Actinomadura nitritigenes TaxID=134602 RepID=UPI003D8EBB4D
MRPPATLTGLPVYALNLDRRPDRWQTLLMHMRSRGLPTPTRFPAIDGRATSTHEELVNYHREIPSGLGARAACLGISKSFLGLLSLLLQDPPEWTLILEDDVMFHADIHTRYAEFASLVPDDALVLLLGCTHARTGDGPAARGRLRSYPVDGTHRLVWRAGKVWCSHAFMASREAIPMLHAVAAQLRTSFDVAWNDVHALGRSYAPNPHLAIQRPGDRSDVANRKHTRPRRQYGPEVR